MKFSKLHSENLHNWYTLSVVYYFLLQLTLRKISWYTLRKASLHWETFISLHYKYSALILNNWFFIWIFSCFERYHFIFPLSIVHIFWIFVFYLVTSTSRFIWEFVYFLEFLVTFCSWMNTEITDYSGLIAVFL